RGRLPARQPAGRARGRLARDRARPVGGRRPAEEGLTMRLQGPAKRLTVYVGESDRHHHKPLYVEIVHRAHAAGLAGATVLRGIEGFGASRHVHTTRILSLTEDLPVVVVLVDEAERIERFALE